MIEHRYFTTDVTINPTFVVLSAIHKSTVHLCPNICHVLPSLFNTVIDNTSANIENDCLYCMKHCQSIPIRYSVTLLILFIKAYLLIKHWLIHSYLPLACILISTTVYLSYSKSEQAQHTAWQILPLPGNTFRWDYDNRRTISQSSIHFHVTVTLTEKLTI